MCDILGHKYRLIVSLHNMILEILVLEFEFNLLAKKQKGIGFESSYLNYLQMFLYLAFAQLG